MTKDQKIIKGNVGLLELAKQLGNIKPSLQDARLQPRQLLPVQGAFDKGGELALQKIYNKERILANWMAPEIEARIVAFSLEQPAFGQSPTK
jgi:hypothetical protein